MRYILKNYQERASNELIRAIRQASRDFAEDSSDLRAISLSAPTGAGKTVIAAAVIEALFNGTNAVPEDPMATVLWVTDDPALNEQTLRKMIDASSQLPASKLVTIDSSFDQETFSPNTVYFLNIQKLARTNPLAQSTPEQRDYSLWQTISNTITRNGAHFIVVIDEAHRGMNPSGDRVTIVSRIINGQRNINPPAPIVWGISATPQRFTDATANRTTRPVTVSIDEVRGSGLLKDLIILENPESGAFETDTTLVRAGVGKTLEFEESWGRYADSQGEPAVLPILVLQVPNTPSEPEMLELLGAIFEAWPELADANIVNTFGEHTSLSIGRHTIRYLAPQEIQDDLTARVVLCKDAISTGWDCPRAEVLISLRAAEDFTYISQLIGRMVRTPLARRILTDQTLNTVNCLLPRFNKEQVKTIVDRFQSGSNDDPQVEVVVDPVRVWRSQTVPQEVFDLIAELPSYIVPGKAYRSQVSRLFALAALLSGDNVVEEAIRQGREHLLGVLETHKTRFEMDGSLEQNLRQIQTLRVERSFALLGAETLEDLTDFQSYEVELDANNIEDLFRVAKRKLPEGIAQAYWDRLLDHDQEEDLDSVDAKALVAALALRRDVIEAVEAAAAQLVQTWLRQYQRAISALSDTRKAAYDPIKREALQPELTDIILPETRIERDSADHWQKHLLCDEKGEFPSSLKGWEKGVLRTELSDTDLVGWYRNPTGGDRSLRIPYPGENRDLAMYPDFIFFHQTDYGIQASIVDPHGHHLWDAYPKLLGLAKYASEHGSQFARIESVIEADSGDLLSLDLKSEHTRAVIERSADRNVEAIFREAGGNYR